MSKLLQYKKQSSFTGEELVQAVNYILRGKHLQLFNKRALRFYVAQTIVPPPIGPTKFARYSYMHLLLILSVRMMQYEGKKLEGIQDRLHGENACSQQDLENMLSEWIGEEASQYEEMTKVAESSVLYTSLPAFKGVYRIPIGTHCVMELEAGVGLKEQLKLISDEISQLLKQVDKH